MQNLKRNWLVVSKLTWGIWQILTRALESLKNVHFDVLFLSRVYIVWAKKVQRSYLSWHWRVIQNLERNQHVVSKLTWGIWQILTRALENLKNFDFNGLFLSRVYIVWAKKVQRSYLSWHWRVIQNFERNQLVVSKLTRGIWHSLTWALGGLKNFPFNGLLLSKVYTVWDKKYRGVIFHDIEEWYKIWRGINLLFANWYEEFDKFWLDHLNVSEIFTLMGSFWTEYILSELKKYRGVIFHDTEEWYKIRRGIDLLCVSKLTWGIWQILTRALKWQNWDFDGILLSKVENLWA